VGTYSDIRDHRYRTELDIGTSDIGLKRAESDTISDIGINFYPISDIRHPNILRSAQWLRSKAIAYVNQGLGFESTNIKYIYWISDIGMDSDFYIGTLPISE
jgi:hypothetical protein